MSGCGRAGWRWDRDAATSTRGVDASWSPAAAYGLVAGELRHGATDRQGHRHDGGNRCGPVREDRTGPDQRDSAARRGQGLSAPLPDHGGAVRRHGAIRTHGSGRDQQDEGQRQGGRAQDPLARRRHRGGHGRNPVRGRGGGRGHALRRLQGRVLHRVGDQGAARGEDLVGGPAHHVRPTSVEHGAVGRPHGVGAPRRDRQGSERLHHPRHGLHQRHVGQRRADHRSAAQPWHADPHRQQPLRLQRPLHEGHRGRAFPVRRRRGLGDDGRHRSVARSPVLGRHHRGGSDGGRACRWRLSGRHTRRGGERRDRSRGSHEPRGGRHVRRGDLRVDLGRRRRERSRLRGQVAPRQGRPGSIGFAHRGRGERPGARAVQRAIPRGCSASVAGTGVVPCVGRGASAVRRRVAQTFGSEGGCDGHHADRCAGRRAFGGHPARQAVVGR